MMTTRMPVCVHIWTVRVYIFNKNSSYACVCANSIPQQTITESAESEEPQTHPHPIRITPDMPLVIPDDDNPDGESHKVPPQRSVTFDQLRTWNTAQLAKYVSTRLRLPDHVSRFIKHHQIDGDSLVHKTVGNLRSLGMSDNHAVKIMQFVIRLKKNPALLNKQPPRLTPSEANALKKAAMAHKQKRKAAAPPPPAAAAAAGMVNGSKSNRSTGVNVGGGNAKKTAKRVQRRQQKRRVANNPVKNNNQKKKQKQSQQQLRKNISNKFSENHDDQDHKDDEDDVLKLIAEEKRHRDEEERRAVAKAAVEAAERARAADEEEDVTTALKERELLEQLEDKYVEPEKGYEWRAGDTCQTMVDGLWRHAFIKKVRKGHPYVQVEGMLGVLYNQRLRITREEFEMRTKGENVNENNSSSYGAPVSKASTIPTSQRGKIAQESAMKKAQEKTISAAKEAARTIAKKKADAMHEKSDRLIDSESNLEENNKMKLTKQQRQQHHSREVWSASKRGVTAPAPTATTNKKNMSKSQEKAKNTGGSLTTRKNSLTTRKRRALPSGNSGADAKSSKKQRRLQQHKQQDRRFKSGTKGSLEKKHKVTKVDTSESRTREGTILDLTKPEHDSDEEDRHLDELVMSDEFRQLVEQVVNESTGSLTKKIIRRKLEEMLDLDPDTLKSRKKIIGQYIEAVTEHQ
uniref:DEK C-terminal domain-containing protein n=1 Tax=Lotharella globosa TaxID=91324 RepID=A0A7S3YN71_9EUKA|mmetsp:Transcript_26663/g.52079  ORF Transcript_26663/g.52079 Transcript_26663/m.52079 type:complete len:687 (+) Transcript_26663:493-2553(+)